MMKIVTRQIKARNNRMVHISRYFLRHTFISRFARENFTRVINEGMMITRKLDDTRVGARVNVEIENYLIACEEVLKTAGEEMELEYCDLLEDLDDFRDERLLLMKLLDNKLDNSLFI